MPKTTIAWTDYSWPVVNGCRRVSEGCRRCYAERLAATRLSKTPKYAGLARMERAVLGDGSGTVGYVPRWTGKTRLWERDLTVPLRLKKPSRIFVADMGDLFYEEVPFAWVDRVFAVMALAPQHTFQVLTKRPERAARYLNAPGVAARIGSAAKAYGRPPPVLLHEYSEGLFESRWFVHPWPLPNVWFGFSAEDQDTFDDRYEDARHVPCSVLYCSYEPALAHVDFTWAFERDHHDGSHRPLDWLIVGGESGPRARPCDLAWARSAVAQSAAAHVPCFVKQLGRNPLLDGACLTWDLDRSKGADPTEWPPDLRVREWPQQGGS